MISRFKKVYQFKVTLKSMRPPIWRRIQVPGNYSFWDLHVAIQDAMGWTDTHLHVFEIINPRKDFKEEIGIPDEEFGSDGPRVLAGWEKKISKYFTARNNEAIYIYDFGDDWQHTVKFEKILDRDKNVQYPLCLTGKRACPPEDCGGIWGYQELLEILSDSGHEEYEERIEWLGEDFDPEHFDVKEIHFDDPKDRWDYALGDDVDWSEDEIATENDEIFRELRVFQREQMYEIWEKAKCSDLEDLDSEQRRLARIMLEHEDEFFNAFEFADVTAESEYDPDTDVNPFLHTYIHLAVETQIEKKDPIESYQFYNAMRKKNCSHHNAIHLIGAIFIPFMFNTLKYKKPFDLDAFKTLLKKYKNRHPNKILDLLDSESILPE